MQQYTGPHYLDHANLTHQTLMKGQTQTTICSVGIDSRVPLNDLSRLSDAEKKSILKACSVALDSGVYLNGSNVRALESELDSYLGGRQTVALANGSDALFVALSALGVGAQDRVATVGNAAGYATSAILRVGASPILVDVDPLTSQISIDDFESLVRADRDLRAVIVPHLYGLMADVEALESTCQRHSIFLIEDCAQSFGAMTRDRLAGSWGVASAFSFYPTKNLAALGDGGCVAFTNEAHATSARKIAQYGWISKYEVEVLNGINSRLDEIQAAVVLSRLSSVDERNAIRRKILRSYAEAVSAPRRFIFEDSSHCVAHLAIMRTPTREDDREKLRAAGIETSIHYPIPDHHQPAWRQFFEGVELPNTETHCREALTLPCFPELTESEIDRVCRALREL